MGMVATEAVGGGCAPRHYFDERHRKAIRYDPRLEGSGLDDPQSILSIMKKYDFSDFEGFEGDPFERNA